MASPAAVVRVKRKRNEDPASALVLSFKRPRDGSDDVANEIFQFTGTTPATNMHDEHSTSEELKRILVNQKIDADRRTRMKDRRFYKLHVADVRLKCKKEKEESIRQQRQDLILSLRSIELWDSDKDDQPDSRSQSPSVRDEKAISLPSTSLSCISCNDQAMIRIQQPVDSDYVFDYYVSSLFRNDQNADDPETVDSFLSPTERHRRTSSSSSNPGLDVSTYFENLIAVYPYNLCEDAIDNETDVNLNEEEEDDEDSNAEDNWRNDYPDEDEDFDKRYDFYDNTNYASDNDESAWGYDTYGDDRVTEYMQHLDLGDDIDE